MAADPAIVIQIYKPEPDKIERISLEQCFRILGRYPVYLVKPPHVDPGPYQEYGKFEGVLDSGLLGSIPGYNRLMLSPGFYRNFLPREYILIYQLDCFVFEDNLQEWCGTGYDYIGAPWTGVPWMQGMKHKRYVGNGGFSLRKVRSTIRNLLLFYPRVRLWRHNEDIFYSFFVARYNPWFRVPRVREALKFAFESDPERCYRMNHRQLPFGIHAWHKHDPEFWRPFLRERGYEF